MSEAKKRICDVCIGCGRCDDYSDASLQIVTNSFLRQVQGAKSDTSFILADIGTTTIAMELYDSEGNKVAEYVRPNPQRTFGADVISRILAAQNPMNAKQMQSLVKKILRDGVKEFRNAYKNQETETCDEAPVSLCNTVMYIAANTTMLYLLMGHDTAPLGEAPFRAEYLEAESLSLDGVHALILPGLSAFVGADVLAGILACAIQEKEDVSLLIDLGTNGEIVLGNKEKIYACATAAGPAFEGMLKAEGQAVWGADVVKCVAALLKEGVLDETGLLAEPYFSEGISVGGVKLTQEHIRNLQTAKAAIASGIKILTDKFGIGPKDVKNVYLAGGFGYFLEEEAAIKIGLIPKEFQGRTKAVGNSALAGCFAYHTDAEKAEKITRIKELTRVINLADEKDFADIFVSNMNFE